MVQPKEKGNDLSTADDGSKHASLSSLSKAALLLRAKKVHPDGNDLERTATSSSSHASLTQANDSVDQSPELLALTQPHALTQPDGRE